MGWRNILGPDPGTGNDSCAQGEGRAYFSSHSCSGAVWNFQVRLGPAITLR
jgi:hypothetical protein